MNSEDANEIESMNITDLILPCPICGKKKIKIIANGRMFSAKQGYSTYSSVSILHHCEFPDNKFIQPLQRTGKTLQEAIDCWNIRFHQFRKPILCYF